MQVQDAVVICVQQGIFTSRACIAKPADLLLDDDPQSIRYKHE